MSLSDEQIERYSRQIILPEVGGVGQQRLLEARVLIVGAGAVGSAAALYLAAAGVGCLGLVDGDVLSLTALRRQVLCTAGDLGDRKVEAASDSLARLNPDCRARCEARRLAPAEAAATVAEFDVVVDTAPGHDLRVALNRACVAEEKPLLCGGAAGAGGWLSTFLGFRPDLPCAECAGHEPLAASRAEGLSGAAAGLVGTLLATEVLKLILGSGRSLAGRWLICDLAAAGFRDLEIGKANDCATCGGAPLQRRAAV